MHCKSDFKQDFKNFYDFVIFIMNSNSTDEDEPTPPILLDDNIEEYMETCDNEIKDIVPRLQKLNVNDEPKELRSEIFKKPCSSTETITSLINVDEKISIADVSVKVSTSVSNETADKNSINENTKAASGIENSISTCNQIAHPSHANILFGNQSQDNVQKTSESLAVHMHAINQNNKQKLHKSEEIKDTGDEIVLDKSPVNRFPKQRFDQNYAAGTSYTKPEIRSEPVSVKVATKKIKQVDPETGEESNTSSVILPEGRGNDRIDDKRKMDALEQYNTIAGFPPQIQKPSYSTEVSSDDQSNKNRDLMNYSTPDTHDTGAVNKASVEAKRHRKIAVFANPAPQINQIRQRRFSIFKRFSDSISELETSRADSISDDESKKSGAIEKNSTKHSRRQCRKFKSSSTTRFPNSSDVKNEEKRPNPCKRKQRSTENLDENTGKFRKRCASECSLNSQSVIEKPQSDVRSRSSSLGLKENNPSVEISSTRKSRKRTSSDFQNVDQVKSRRSSSSSDDSKNK